MNKKELIQSAAAKSNMSQTATAQALAAIIETISDGLENNKSTIIQGFGSFSVAKRVKRMGINPLTKESITIPARKVVKFSASKKIILK